MHMCLHGDGTVTERGKKEGKGARETPPFTARAIKRYLGLERTRPRLLDTCLHHSHR